MAQLESHELGGKGLAEDEFAYTDKIIRGNLSNFSLGIIESKSS